MSTNEGDPIVLEAGKLVCKSYKYSIAKAGTKYYIIC